jgi:hypothetical protein
MAARKEKVEAKGSPRSPKRKKQGAQKNGQVAGGEPLASVKSEPDEADAAASSDSVCKLLSGLP